MTSQNLTSLQHQFADWEQVQEYYLGANLTDGLPIMPPTEDRVRAMLEFSGLPPDQIIGFESIRQKHITAEKVAINAVMAGCRPEYFPVVTSAIAACCEPVFNLHASSTSTNGVTVLVLVSGDYAQKIGMNSSTGLMGPSNHANASIGRAVNLVKTNFYGSIPQEMDNSTFGHPGKYTFCFAENLDAGNWPSLAVDKGFDGSSSAVTVVAAYSPLQVSVFGGKDPESFLAGVAHAMIGLGPSVSEVFVALSPEVMQYVDEAGWSKQQVQEFLWEKARLPAKEWIAWRRVEHPDRFPDKDQLVGCVADPSRITLFAAGGAAGVYVDVIGSWGNSRPVTRKIEVRS